MAESDVKQEPTASISNIEIQATTPKPIAESLQDYVNDLKESVGEQREKRSDQVKQATQLVNIAKHDGTLWHTSEYESYITMRSKDGSMVNMKIDSQDFRRQLSYLYYESTSDIPTSNNVDNAIETLGGLAIHEGALHDTFLRIAGFEGKIYVDIGDPSWRCIEISESGWSVVKNPPIKFRRSSGLAALPEPITDGSIGPLREFINVETMNDFILTVAFLVMSYHPHGEYPILAAYGQQGSSKSTTARVIRTLCDPNSAPLRSTPRTEDDFSIMAFNNWMMVFDNLSFVPDWLSDALCRLATGGTNAKRKNYSDREEILVSYCGPALINGVVDLARRPDLLDRCLLIELPVLSKRVAKSEFWKAFDKQAGWILGGLLDAIVYALAHPAEPSEELPRMAEFAIWIMAAEPSLSTQWNEYASPTNEWTERWEKGDFLKAYEENIAKATASALEQSPIVRHLIVLVNERGGRIEMSATELFKKLNERATNEREFTRKEAGWPQSAGVLGTVLQRLAPVFRQISFSVERKRESGGNRDRFWEIINLAHHEKSCKLELSDTRETVHDNSGFNPTSLNPRSILRPRGMIDPGLLEALAKQTPLVTPAPKRVDDPDLQCQEFPAGPSGESPIDEVQDMIDRLQAITNDQELDAT